MYMYICVFICDTFFVGSNVNRGRRGCDRMVVGFITTSAINAGLSPLKL
jgi:hypothetical protein